MSRVALVTGAAGGIGRATAELFAKEGWQVVGVDLIEPPAAAPGRHLVADLADPKAVRSVIEEVACQEGRLDALVSNAALQVAKPLVDTAPEEWDAVLAVNLRAPFLLARHAHPLLKSVRGSIVNVASVHALATSVNIAAYAASKAGLVGLTRAMALEWAPDGVRANALLPGAVDTGMLRAGLTRGHLLGADAEARLDALAKRHPVGRVGRPEEIAQAILFLADGERSSFMTGQALVLDGGALARLSTE